MKTLVYTIALYGALHLLLTLTSAVMRLLGIA